MSNEIPPVPVILLTLGYVPVVSVKVTVHVNVFFDVNSLLRTLSLLDMLNILDVLSCEA